MIPAKDVEFLAHLRHLHKHDIEQHSFLLEVLVGDDPLAHHLLKASKVREHANKLKMVAPSALGNIFVATLVIVAELLNFFLLVHKFGCVKVVFLGVLYAVLVI